MGRAFPPRIFVVVVTGPNMAAVERRDEELPSGLMARPSARHRRSTSVNPVRRLIRIKRDDHLVNNAVFQMLSTGGMAVAGFVFWTLCARIYTPAQVGQGTALISASGLLGLATLLGLNTTLIRY